MSSLLPSSLPPFPEMNANYEFHNSYGHFNVNNEAHLTRPDVNGHILWWITYLVKSDGNHDKDLWEIYKEDFEGWEKEIFDIADKKALRDLRTSLREHGVFVRTTRGVSIADTLMEVLKEEEPHTWTPEDIEEQRKFRAKKEKEHQRREAYIQAKANRRS